jgi:2-polyprenyl-6-methoxyphenol hydroxylase-like FAD-dependent oxidoreductase
MNHFNREIVFGGLAMALQREIGKRAVVIGGSFAGKLAARVLSDFFAEVIIIEKDHKNVNISTTKGVPQGAQGHVLLKSGEEILEELFPGIIQDLVRDGSRQSDFAEDLSWFHHGSWKARYDSGLTIIQQSRPFLEWHIQRKLEAIPNIMYRYSSKVKRVIFIENEISGIVAENADGNTVEIMADIVVDASGAASFTTRWLKDFGFEQPQKTEVGVDLFYASMIYKNLCHKDCNWHSILVYPNPPELERGGSISPIEGNRYLVTLLGYGEKTIPNDHASFLRYAKTLGQPDIHEMIKNAVPDSEIEVYRFPALSRYHYEKYRKFPAGLLVIGDSFCRVDPVFAQGMSIASMEVYAMRSLLLRYRNKQKLTRDFHNKVSKIIDIPWLIALTEDFRFKNTRGIKPLGLPLLQWYVKKVVNACSHNEKVYGHFLKVLHLKAHPISLFKPMVVAGVFASTKNEK